MPVIYRHRVAITTSGVSSLMTTYWSTSNTTPDSPSATEAAARVRAMLNSAGARFLAGTTFAFDPLVQIIDEATGTLVDVATATAPGSITVSGSGSILPPQTQGLARFGTPRYVRGRALKGRMYLPGALAADNQASGTPGSVYVSSWNTALGLLGTTITVPISQVVWSRPTAPGASDGSSGAVTSRTVAPTWSVQRGRRS